MKKQRSPYKIDPLKYTKLTQIFSKLQTKRKRYCLQVLKQFILFPDDTDSSQKTVCKYDSLIFSDQLIHTMVKKMQTKLIQCKIWAFLNLKYYRYLKAAKKMEEPIKHIQHRVEKDNKLFSFISIKTHSEIKLNNKKTVVSTHTQVQNASKKSIVSPSKANIVSPRKAQGSTTKIEINVEYRHEMRVISPLPSNKSLQSSREKVNVFYYQQPGTIQSQPQLAYPLSQLHPSHIKQNTSQIQPSPSTIQHQEASVIRPPRLMAAQPAADNRERSRSGSIIRYQYDINGSKRIIVNGKQVPIHIKLKRSESPMEQPEYRVSKERVRLQQPRYEFGGINRIQQQKRQNLKYEYHHKPNPPQIKITSPRNYNQNTNQRQQTKPLCNQCGEKHSNNLICSKRTVQKVTRLRSTSKGGQSRGYLQHLNS